LLARVLHQSAALEDGRMMHALAKQAEAGATEVADAAGDYVTDVHGKRYLDFAMGWCVGNLGWRHPGIEAAMRGFDGPTYVHPAYEYRPAEQLAERLLSLAPRNLRKVFRATGGTEAVELALQAAMLVTRRHGLLSLRDAYHGNSLGTLSIGSSDLRGRAHAGLPRCHKLAGPFDARAAERAEVLMKTREIAAFVMEPVICNLGGIVPDAAFVSRLRALCRKYGTLFVADEVACGFGRSGRMFACEHFDLDPDILCVGKAITGGHAPMGATLMTARVGETMEDNGDFWSTYGWHPRSVCAAAATLDVFEERGDELFANATTLGAHARERLAFMPFTSEVNVRGVGFIIGVELERGREAKRVKERCRERGLLLASAGDETLQLFPSLTIDEKTLEHGLDIIESAVRGPRRKAPRTLPRVRHPATSSAREKPGLAARRGSPVAGRVRPR
jgi:4-aminobutyrate aminotransferase-like enzyme